MDLKRTAARGVAVLAVALGAGHLVQTMASKSSADKGAQLAADSTKRPQNVVPLAAGPEATKPAPTASPVMPAPQLPSQAEAAPVVTPELAPATLPALAETPAAVSPEPALACDITLDLIPGTSAMIGLTLLAPCHPNERVVLKHAGLAVTVMTTAGGALFTELPALDAAGQIKASFADGAEVEASLPVADLSGYRRFGVQWQGDDAFQVHSFENTQDYGQPGDINAANTGMPLDNAPSKGGFLTVLGDPLAPSPLFAEIYTFPMDPATKADVVVEAAVTEKTCGRELLGETLASVGGTVTARELTLSMPECDAVGDYLVLKNLAQDVSIAAAN